MRCKLALISVFLLGFSPANAAYVSAQRGDVFINQGHGFIPLGGTAPVELGGQVMVREGGEALVYFDEACSVKVSSNSTFVVSAERPCPPGQNFVELRSAVEQSTWRTTSSAAPGSPGGASAPLFGGGGWSGPVIIGGIVLGAGAIALAAGGGGGGGGSGPASP